MDLIKEIEEIRKRHIARTDRKRYDYGVKGMELGHHKQKIEGPSVERQKQFSGKAYTKTFGCKNVDTYTNKLQEASKSQPAEKAWRVTSNPDEFKSYHPNAKMHVTPGGSTIAVDNGNIVGVCKKKGDKINGKKLLNLAVRNGGDRLDSFAGNHDFYVSCGFEPVSWCAFDKNYAPDGWTEGRDQEEPVIFYQYTGRSREEIQKDYPDADAFTSKVPKADDYDSAEAQRNERMKKK